MLIVLLIVLASSFTVSGVPNGLGVTPQMGWNSWNAYGCGVTEQLMMKNGQLLVELGLSAAGYQYLNVDDCWALSRNKSGVLQADPSTFPSGMAALASFAHGLGLRFGLYTDAGTKTCQGRPGSMGYEQTDADTFAAWGVDYVKVDNCNNDGVPPQQRFGVMGAALAAAGRPMFFSMCEWGDDDPALWAPALANSWRTSHDIHNSWDSMMKNIEASNYWWKYAAPGGWNDPDMLECPDPSVSGSLTEPEFRVHFTLWAVAKAPLIVGCPLDRLSDQTLAVLNNSEVVAVNQDPLGVQAHIVQRTSNYQIWSGPLAGGRTVVALVNLDDKHSRDISFDFATIGLSNADQLSMRDVYKHQDIGVYSSPYTTQVGPHHVVALIATVVSS